MVVLVHRENTEPLLDEMEIIELQGTLAIPDHLRSSSDDSSVAASASSRDVYLGTVEKQGGKKATLNIGTLVVEGEVNPFKKKVLILRRCDNGVVVEPKDDRPAAQSALRKRPRSESLRAESTLSTAAQDGPMLLEEWLSVQDNEVNVARSVQEMIVEAAEAGGKEYKVVGVAKQHYLFKGKPTRIFK